MALPSTELFESFLSATKLVKTKPEGPHIPFDHGERSVSEATILYLSYPEMELKFESVIKRIISEFDAIGCNADRDIAVAALGLIAETRAPGTSSVAHANHCLSSFQIANLHQSVVLPNKPSSEYEIQIGQFWLKAFDPKRILYWASRGQSTYPIDLNVLKGCIALERSPLATKLIDWGNLSGCARLVAKWGNKIATESIMDIYYQAVARLFSRRIPILIKEDLMIQESGALVYIEIDSLLNSIMAHHIGLFHWKRAARHISWALLHSGSVLHMNFVPPAMFVTCEKWLRDEFDFHGLSTSKPLDSAIASYCRFLQRAQTHRLHNRPDEAFLHFVIALDLLLGLEGRSSESVCLRAAVLVHRQLGTPLDVQIGQLKRLYDRRSKYVHEGKPPTGSDLREIEKICIEVLWDLLATSGSGGINDVDAWLKELDFIAGAIKASRQVPDNEFQSVGIPSIERRRVPPNRIESPL
jgi:hypothetical protein